MTLFFNLRRLGWRHTPLLRIQLPDLPSNVVFWRLVVVLLLWACTMLSVAFVNTRNTMADELVRARMKATEYELDVICLLRPECSLRSWGRMGSITRFTLFAVQSLI